MSSAEQAGPEGLVTTIGEVVNNTAYPVVIVNTQFLGEGGTFPPGNHTLSKSMHIPWWNKNNDGPYLTFAFAQNQGSVFCWVWQNGADIRQDASLPPDSTSGTGQTGLIGKALTCTINSPSSVVLST